MAPRVDDLRVRQDQLDEGHVQPVVGQLVDKVRSIGPTLRARTLQIFLAELASGARVQCEHILRISADPARKPGNVLKLGRALDQAMARQDLLKQSRS